MTPVHPSLPLESSTLIELPPPPLPRLIQKKASSAWSDSACHPPFQRTRHPSSPTNAEPPAPQSAKVTSRPTCADGTGSRVCVLQRARAVRARGSAPPFLSLGSVLALSWCSSAKREFAWDEVEFCYGDCLSMYLPLRMI